MWTVNFLISGWGTHVSRTGEGNGNPLQCSCLENPRNGGAWWAAISGVAQSRTRLKRLSSSSSSRSLSKSHPLEADHTAGCSPPEQRMAREWLCVKVWMECLWSGTEEEVWGGWGKLWLWTGPSLSIEYWQQKPQICIFNKFPGDALSQSSVIY